jgi:hypothetical protein
VEPLPTKETHPTQPPVSIEKNKTLLYDIFHSLLVSNFEPVVVVVVFAVTTPARSLLSLGWRCGFFLPLSVRASLGIVFPFHFVFSFFLHHLGYDARANRNPALAHVKAQPLFECNGRVQFDRHGGIVTGHDHFSILWQKE